MPKGVKEKTLLKPAIVIPFTVVALCLAGYMAYRSFAPPPMSVMPMRPEIKWVQEVGARVKYDMSKLTPEELKRLQEITGGQGQRAFDQLANPSGGYK